MKKELDVSENHSVTDSEIDISKSISKELPQENYTSEKYLPRSRMKSYLMTEEQEKYYQDSKAIDMYDNPSYNSIMVDEQRENNQFPLVDYENLEIIRNSFSHLVDQMNNFKEYFIANKRKTRSVKRSLMGSFCRGLSCSSQSDQPRKRVKTPVSQSLKANMNQNLQPKLSSELSQGHAQQMKRMHKPFNAGATRRHITLYSKERMNSHRDASSKIRTSGTKPTSNLSKKPFTNIINCQKQGFNSDKDTYSLGFSTQNNKLMFRTIDEHQE